MTRLIDADKLRALFDEKCARECAICTYYESCKENLYCGLIDNAPTVEGKTEGEWIHYLGCGVGKAVCSVCGQLGETKKYCGNCGRRIRGGYS